MTKRFHGAEWVAANSKPCAGMFTPRLLRWWRLFTNIPTQFQFPIINFVKTCLKYTSCPRSGVSWNNNYPSQPFYSCEFHYSDSLYGGHVESWAEAICVNGHESKYVTVEWMLRIYFGVYLHTGTRDIAPSVSKLWCWAHGKLKCFLRWLPALLLIAVGLHIFPLGDVIRSLFSYANKAKVYRVATWHTTFHFSREVGLNWVEKSFLVNYLAVMCD